jgi:beta-glucosidase
MVLLRNEKVNDIPLLPLTVDKSKKYALIGELAKIENIGDHGSSRVRPARMSTIFQGVEKGLAEATMTYDDGKTISKAVAAAKNADTTILVIGYKFNDEGEYIPPMGGDRKSLHLLPHDEKLIEAVTAVNPKTIVVMIGGSAVVTPWSDKVNALLMAWYPGQEGGTAVWDVITGKFNPSGKLPLAFPADEKHTPFFDREAKKITYDHYHGYRYLNKNNLKPKFHFGFGLSYTNFKVDAPIFNWDAATLTGNISASISNTGTVDGASVLQVYAAYPKTEVDRPLFEFKDFKRVELNAGSSEKVAFDLSARMFSYYRPETKDWITPAGTYTFYIGTSSDLNDLQSVSCVVEKEVVFEE